MKSEWKFSPDISAVLRSKEGVGVPRNGPSPTYGLGMVVLA